MNTVTRPPLRLQATLLLVLFTFFAVGCSLEPNPVAQSDGVTSYNESVNNGVSETYPVLTDEDLANLLPGFQILETSDRVQSGTLDDESSRRIRRTQGGVVSHRNNGVRIGAWQLWSDETITVSTPNPGSAVVDFYPHPYQFNGCVWMWIDLTSFELPPGRRWDEVAFFYDERDGTYTRYWGFIDYRNMTYNAWPDHFSRYILAIPSGGGN